MRKLASIQRILSLNPIPEADNIEVATILGWHVVVQKGLYKVGDLVVYVEVDSILPEKPEFEFMRPRKFKVKTVKLRGQISQGIVFPLSILPLYSGKQSDYREDADVTEALEITKYEPELPANMRGMARSKYRYKYPALPDTFYRIARMLMTDKAFKKYLLIASGTTFPDFIPKTDETRVQVLQPLLSKHKGALCYVAEKLDGSSITCYLKDGEFGVCSRNVDLKDELGNVFWDTVHAMDIEAKMRSYCNDSNWAIQGELIGEGIQGNKLKIKGHTIRFFNVFDIDMQEYLGLDGLTCAIFAMGLETVPIISADHTLTDDIDYYVQSAEGKSALCPAAEREGIVIRPVYEFEEQDVSRGKLVRNRVSFKAISPKFLLKSGE